MHLHLVLMFLWTLGPGWQRGIKVEEPKSLYLDLSLYTIQGKEGLAEELRCYLTTMSMRVILIAERFRHLNFFWMAPPIRFLSTPYSAAFSDWKIMQVFIFLELSSSFVAIKHSLWIALSYSRSLVLIPTFRTSLLFPGYVPTIRTIFHSYLLCVGSSSNTRSPIWMLSRTRNHLFLGGKYFI